MSETSASGSPASQKQHSPLAWAIATCFGLGHLRPGPGTWTSAAVVAVWWLVAHYHVRAEWLTPTALAVAALITAIGIPAASSLARTKGIADPQLVVVDEAAGQMLALVAVPPAWKYLIVGFILFRGFDISKPPPLRRLERFPAGWGIMLDDLGAGLYAFLVMQLLLYSGVLG